VRDRWNTGGCLVEWGYATHNTQVCKNNLIVPIIYVTPLQINAFSSKGGH